MAPNCRGNLFQWPHLNLLIIQRHLAPLQQAAYLCARFRRDHDRFGLGVSQGRREPTGELFPLQRRQFADAAQKQTRRSIDCVALFQLVDFASGGDPKLELVVVGLLLAGVMISSRKQKQWQQLSSALVFVCESVLPLNGLQLEGHYERTERRRRPI